MSNESDYLLGINQTELDRLQFQHAVWGGVTNAFFDRLGVGAGWKCLDAGAGPGLVSADLRLRVGETGEVVALEPSEMFLAWFRDVIARSGWKNVHARTGTAEGAELPAGYFDLVFVRWVIAFVPDAEAFLAPLVRALKPGGLIAIQDYYYEGLSLFPRGGAFDRMPDVVRAYYKSGGGDAYVTGRLPRLFRTLGLELADFSPHQLAGRPGSGPFEWAQRFFLPHIPLMAEKGLITREEAAAFTADWLAHAADPDALFFSPVVVDAAGRKLEQESSGGRSEIPGHGRS